MEVMACFLKEQKTWPEVCIMLESRVEALSIKSRRVMLSVKRLKKKKNLLFSLGKDTETCCLLGVVTSRRKKTSQNLKLTVGVCICQV